MNLGTLLKAMSEERHNGAVNWTLGQFIEALKALPKDSGIVFKTFGCIPGKLYSYRGYYDDLALDVKGPQYNESAKVSDLLKDAEEAVGKEFIGWKGGEFEMSRDTLLWASNRGACTNMAIVGIEEAFEGMYEIVTEQID